MGGDGINCGDCFLMLTVMQPGNVEALKQTDLNNFLITGSCPSCDLSGALLNWLVLRWANVSKPDLTKANLKGAWLIGADLTGAKLSYSWLQSANLTGANLYSTHLDYATWTDGSTCQWGSLDRCITTSYKTAPPPDYSFDSLTPQISAPASTSSKGLIFKTRYFILYEGDKPLPAIETSGISATVSNGLLCYGRTYTYYVLDISTTDEVISLKGPGTCTNPAKPAGDEAKGGVRDFTQNYRP